MCIRDRTVHCLWEDETVMERIGHLPSYAEAKKMKSLTLHTHGLRNCSSPPPSPSLCPPPPSPSLCPPPSPSLCPSPPLLSSPPRPRPPSPSLCPPPPS